MSERIPILKTNPTASRAMYAFSEAGKTVAKEAGLDPALCELVNIRASQINGCAFCLDMHSKNAVQNGESDKRLHLLAAWRETTLYTEQERAALALTESITRISETADVPDDVYRAAEAVFGPEQLGAVIWVITVINSWNRVNVATRAPLPE